MTTKSGFELEFGIITRNSLKICIEKATKELRHKQPELLQFFQREIEGAKSVPAKVRVLKSWFVDEDWPEE